MEWAVREIKKIQHAARSGKPIIKPRWPVLILRTPKVSLRHHFVHIIIASHDVQGMSGPKEIDGEFIEGSFHSHQVPLPNARSSDKELSMLGDWLSSYNISELIDVETGKPNDAILSIVPDDTKKRLGQKVEANQPSVDLKTPAWEAFAVEKGTQESCMKRIGEFLLEVMKECVVYLSHISSHTQRITSHLTATQNRSVFSPLTSLSATSSMPFFVIREGTSNGMLRRGTMEGGLLRCCRSTCARG